MTRLILPDIDKEITVKIIGSIEHTGDKLYYCNCRIWGLKGIRKINKKGIEDVKENLFRLQITKSIWVSIYNELCFTRDMAIDDDAMEIDPDLNCIIGRIITIKGQASDSIEFEDGSKGKIFVTQFRYDLEEVEKIGGETYTKLVDTELEKCRDTINKNINPRPVIHKKIETHGIIRLGKFTEDENE